MSSCYWIHIISSQSLNLNGSRGTTDDVATIPFYLSLSSAAFRESLPNSIPRSSHGLCMIVQKSPIAIHLKELGPSLEFCCQGPALKGIKECG